ncbi:MAG: 16S rRNA (guanine(1207)-N(2))-methyltransferase RsmC [Psychromonas sp.]|nr:16S rRNA (guanine(1207)-N(2))-methyltransferase RsmC [Psychromonas sp.]
MSHLHLYNHSQPISNPSKLLQRNESLFENRTVLVAGNIDKDYPLNIEKCADSATFCFNNFRIFFALNDKLKLSECHFTANYQSTKKFDLLLIYIPKAKQEIQYLLANLVPHLHSNASILIVGENKCGIKSVHSLLTPYASNINTIDCARHCSLIYCKLTKAVSTFKQTDWIKTCHLEINNITIKIHSLPGVFNHGKLDKGSVLLLQNLPAKMTGSFLDFGCGAGIIACYVKAKFPNVNIDLVDVNAYALESAQLSLKSNAIEGKVFPSDVFSHINKKYNTLVSNPPFHSGKSTDYKTTEDLIKRAPEHLLPKGQLIIVANKFLKYEPLLENAFTNVACPIFTNKFKVLTCFK